ncbi:PorV/PorQ family protein, partial [candidate division KSB1 bacterium]|nr:PorV/PorQ family protein [candidate division KSB1 bacterium]
MKNKISKSKIYVIFSLILIICSMDVSAQIRSGVAYLKMLPGTRGNGMAGSLTGALDFTHSFYANPGAVGFLREWQWSANYSNWISDIYNTSFLYGRRVATPLSRHTRLAVGLSYLGIPEFDNSGGFDQQVNGNHLVATAGFGQPLTFISRNLSIGANVKYFRSQLDEYKANTYVFDTGLILRTPKLGVRNLTGGLFEYFILSTGASIMNMGSPVEFISEETPLPRTYRGGIAMNIGTHRSFQLSVALDYREVRDEDGFFTVGSEISWNQFIAFRFGYSNENNLLGEYTFGTSLQFDDLLLNSIIPGRNNEIKMDLAANQSNNFFASPYQGSITHHPIGPESFDLIEPFWGAKIDSNRIRLAWQDTRDPDLYDDISYRFLLDKDSLQLARVVRIAEENQHNFVNYMDEQDFYAERQLVDNSMDMGLPGGTYYWSVVARDRDGHLRFAEMNNQKIAKFRITEPKPRIIALKFDPDEFITTDAKQGTLSIKVMNLGDRAARDIYVNLYDIISTQLAANVMTNASMNLADYALDSHNLAELLPGEITEIEVVWNTRVHGLHPIVAEVTGNDPLSLESIVYHQHSENFHTIPKGTFSTNKQIDVLEMNRKTYFIPYLGRIYFDASSDSIKKKFLTDWVIEPPLKVFAERLKNGNIKKIVLTGSIDPYSEENDSSLAYNRSRSVFDVFRQLGVDSTRIKISPEVTINRNPARTDYIRQERRFVEISTEPGWEPELFGPITVLYNDSTFNPVKFESDIKAAVPIKYAHLNLRSDIETGMSVLDLFSDKQRLKGNIYWEPLSASNIEWLGKNAAYSFVVKDSLEREFRLPETEDNVVRLDEAVTGNEKFFIVIAKFGDTESYYDFYWQNVKEQVETAIDDTTKKVQFIGHGCAIGSEQLNKKLSESRAEAFKSKLLDEVRAKNP